MSISNLKLDESKNGGVSNLLELSINTFKRKYDELKEKGSFHLYFHDGVSKKRILVRIKDKSSIKKTGKHTWIMNLYDSSNKERLLSSFIHEMMHVNQEYNGMSHYVYSQTYKQYKEKVTDKKYKFSNYYSDYAHSTMMTEKEAKLVQLLYYISIQKHEIAVNFALQEAEYFTFNFKELCKKGVYFKITNDDILLFKTLILEKVNKTLKEYREAYVKTSNSLYLGYHFVYIEDRLPVLNMLNIDVSSMFQWLNKTLDSDYENIIKNYNWNWEYIMSESKRLILK